MKKDVKDLENEIINGLHLQNGRLRGSVAIDFGFKMLKIPF
jgi:hypothetical protein